MNFLYTLATRLVACVLPLLGLFNRKIKLFWKGRKESFRILQTHISRFSGRFCIRQQKSDPSSRWIASGGATEAQRRVSGLRQAAPASGCRTGFGRWLAGLIGGL